MPFRSLKLTSFHKTDPTVPALKRKNGVGLERFYLHKTRAKASLTDIKNNYARKSWQHFKHLIKCMTTLPITCISFLSPFVLFCLASSPSLFLPLQFQFSSCLKTHYKCIHIKLLFLLISFSGSLVKTIPELLECSWFMLPFKKR